MSGSVRIFRLDVLKDSKKIRGRLGYVPSDANLYDEMKVHEFLSFEADFRTDPAILRTCCDLPCHFAARIQEKRHPYITEQ